MLQNDNNASDFMFWHWNMHFVVFVFVLYLFFAKEMARFTDVHMCAKGIEFASL
jgi:hypothetical protein